MIILSFSNKLKGLTLIELMMVTAIIAIAAMVSIPIYSSYITRSRIAAALPVLSQLEREAKILFEDRSAATSLTLGNNTFTNNTVVGLNTAPVVNGLYAYPGGRAGVDTSSFLVCVYVDELSISGYVAPTPGVAGTYSRICRLVTSQNNVYTNRCGALDGSNTDIPVAYLPKDCDCANVISGAC